jgi:hypothetical protein
VADRVLAAMKIHWHRDTEKRYGTPYWYAEIDGTRIAEAANTSQTGSEDYPSARNTRRRATA